MHKKRSAPYTNEKISFSLWFVLVALLLSLQSNAIAWPGEVIGVANGDTIKVMKGSQKIRIRLYSVDTPGKAQEAYVNKAKKATNALVRGRKAEI